MTPFGTLSDGRAVAEIVLRSDALELSLLDYGARLHAVRLDGGPNLCPGCRLDQYEARRSYFGPVIAPVVNRLSGARAHLPGGPELVFAPNEGANLLHSGEAGTQSRVWEVARRDADCVTFRADLPDGEGGFPGNRRVEAAYAVRDREIVFEATAVTDRPTLMNIASHGVWNLDGSDDWRGHRLQIPAGRYLPADGATLPTGEIAPVEGTAFDYREAREPEPWIDHNFCFEPSAEPRLMAVLTGASGRRMEVVSDAPGLQVYTGGRAAIALEPQLWPDAPRHRAFPSIVLQPGETFRQRVIYRFS